MRLSSLMEALPPEIDSALILTPQNRRYFTSFASSDGFLLVTRSGSIFYTDSRYIEAAQKQITCCDVQEGKSVFAQMRDFLTARNVRSIAVETEGLTVAQMNRLQKREELKGFTFVCDGALDAAIGTFRSVKTRDEVAKIRQAQAIAELGFSHILNFIRPGRTEKEIQLELDFFMLKNGAQALSFDTIVVSGVNSSMPHGVPSDKKIEDGDFITMDFGAVVDGYHSDMTRTVAVGHVSEEQKTVYETVLSAQEASLAALKAGLSCREGDKKARDLIANAGYGEFFGHGTGHGVGIEIHEEPRLSPSCDAVLTVGNVVTVEPGIYLPGKFGVRIEDMAYITENGCENLTSAQKSLILL